MKIITHFSPRLVSPMSLSLKSSLAIRLLGRSFARDIFRAETSNEIFLSSVWGVFFHSCVKKMGKKRKCRYIAVLPSYQWD